jgi:hypothetical protein
MHVFVGMFVLVSVTMLVFAVVMVMMIIVRVNVRRRIQPRGRGGFFDGVTVLEDVDLEGANTAAVYRMDAELGSDAEGAGRVLEQRFRHAGSEQRAEKHVARDSGEAFKDSNLHGHLQAFRPLAASISGGRSSFIDPER